MEILAPAGNLEILKVAIQAGCDAVYISGKDFGARKFANNFSNEEMIEGITYAHLRNVKIYVTVSRVFISNTGSPYHRQCSASNLLFCQADILRRNSEHQSFYNRYRSRHRRRFL